jgi:hypothetical protein
MRPIRLLMLLVLSGLATYFVEHYSFTLAHSASGMLAVLVCPGILVVVANLIDGPLAWAIVVLVNVAYYELLWRLTRPNRKAL